MSYLLYMRNLSLLLTIGMAGFIILTFAGCSVGGKLETLGAPGISQPETADLPHSLPQVPSGESDVRQGTMIDTDHVQGDAFIDEAGVVIEGSAAMITAGITPADDLAFAMYQHVARPDPAVPYMVNVLGYFQDEDPQNDYPEDGYYVAYADYALHRWVISGLLRTVNTRIAIPVTADVVSPGGFVYTAILAYNGNAVRVSNVHIGYDSGLGYEQYVLPPGIGESVGTDCDIELDENDNPQIAYLGLNSFMNSAGHIYLASKNGGTWETQTLPSALPIHTFDFAIGSGGRRALVTVDSDTSEIHLKLDLGTGEFTTNDLLPAPHHSSLAPTVVYVNGADNPVGERDTALVVYGGSYTYPKVELMYFAYDGINPSASGTILGVKTEEVRKVGLTELSDKKAMVAIPVAIPLSNSDCEFHIYSAGTDTWSPAITDWSDLIITGDTNEGVLLRELPNGNIVAGFRNGDAAEIDLGIYDGMTWNSELSDKVSCSRNGSFLDLEVFSNNEVAFPAIYGGSSPMLYSGAIADGNSMEPTYINNEPKSCAYISIAVDTADDVHIAWHDSRGGMLVYNKLESGILTGEEIADNGANGTSVGIGNAHLVAEDDVLHVFHTDSVHGQIVYSRNNGGVWKIEQQPILNHRAVPYLIFHAGLLENTGQLYLAYLDLSDYGNYLTISDEARENWSTHEIAAFSPGLYDLALSIADDESTIAAIYPGFDMISQGISPMFELGVENPLTSVKETVCPDILLCEKPWSLAYNSFDSTWYFATNHSSLPRCHLFSRIAPGTWYGPDVISETAPGTDAKSSVVGLTCRSSDGHLMAVVEEQVAGTTIRETFVVSSPPDVIQFTMPELVSTYDTTSTQSDAITVVPDAGGMPVIAQLEKIGAATTWDVNLYMPDAGSWTLSETWASPVIRALEEFEFGLAVMGNGLPAVVLVDHEDNTPLFGRPVVYYPW